MLIKKIGDVYNIYPARVFEYKSVKKPMYLLGVYYDGASGKAVLEFVTEDGGQLYLVHDPTDHKPYFLTDLAPEEIEKKAEIIRHKSFERIEVVNKFDPLSNRVKRMTKIVTKDPLAVVSLRNKVPKAWEAKIKYHDNYVFVIIVLN